MDQDKSAERQKAEWAVRVEKAAREYTRAYDIRRRAPKKRLTPERLKKAEEAMRCLRILVATCELYQREVPAAREEVEELIRQLDEPRGR